MYCYSPNAHHGIGILNLNSLLALDMLEFGQILISVLIFVFLGPKLVEQEFLSKLIAFSFKYLSQATMLPIARVQSKGYVGKEHLIVK